MILPRALDVGPGSSLDVYAYGRPRTVTIDRVLPRRGVAGFGTDNEDDQRAFNVLVSPATFGAMLRGGVETGAPPTWIVAVSNRGGVESGAKLSDEVEAAIDQTAAGLDPQVTPIKQQVLDVADELGKTFTQMFTAMGSFGVFAGLLLLINLFVMLAAERKAELGMARAVGMRPPRARRRVRDRGLSLRAGGDAARHARRRRARPRCSSRGRRAHSTPNTAGSRCTSPSRRRASRSRSRSRSSSRC